MGVYETPFSIQEADRRLLFDDGQFVDDVVALADFFDAPQQVAGIHADGALHLVLEGEVAAHGFPVAAINSISGVKNTVVAHKNAQFDNVMYCTPIVAPV